MSDRQQGRIKQWKADKGFGFIETETGDEVFFHISAFKAPRHPEMGELVVFSLGRDKQGRRQATQVQELSFVQQQMAQKNKQIRRRNAQRRQQSDFAVGQKKRLFIGIGFYVVLLLLVFTGALSWLVVGWYVLIGIITYLTYAKDKAAAQNNQWRTSESTLHVLSALGGWVGAMIAQTYLRHKSQKAEFRMTYYLTVLINMAVLLVILAKPNFIGML